MQAAQARLSEAETTPANPLGSTPLVSIAALRHVYANGREIHLRAPLTLAAGQAAMVTGPSGAGKSTLLRALADCLPEGGQTGWNSAGLSSPVLPQHALLALQEPDAQLLCSTVEEEVAFGVANLGIERATAGLRVDEALDAVGMGSLRTRNVEALSTGEKYRVVLAALLAMHPRVLLLDEPFSQLDARGREQLRGIMQRLKAQGGVVIATAHERPADDSFWDAHLRLESREGRLRPERPPAPAAAVRFAEGAIRIAWGDQSLEFLRGSTTHIAGDNGAGKSTLLRSCAENLSATMQVGYLPQNTDLLLFEQTVEREVGFTLRREPLTAERRRARIARMLSLCGLTLVANQSPLCLSHGERQMVALASVLAAQAPVLLLDEPLAGLDRDLARHVLDLLDYAARVHGAAVVLASHGNLARDWGERRILIEGGRLRAA